MKLQGFYLRVSKNKFLHQIKELYLLWNSVDIGFMSSQVHSPLRKQKQFCLYFFLTITRLTEIEFEMF